jgi:hypothetical protein
LTFAGARVTRRTVTPLSTPTHQQEQRLHVEEARRAPSSDAQSAGPVEAGAAVQASPQVVHGFRRVKLADGKTGYVDAKVLEVAGAQAAPAPAAP